MVPEMSDGRQEALPDKASAHQATRRESPGPLRGNRIGLHREGGLSCPLSRTHAGTLSSLRSFWVIRSTCASWGEGTASTTGTAMKNTRRLGVRSGAVCIALPNDLHCEYAERAANMGIHVLCEKPVAPSVPNCEAMIEAAQRIWMPITTSTTTSW